MPKLRCSIYQHGVDLARDIDVEGSLDDAKRVSAQLIEELGPVQDGATAWGAGNEFVDYELRILNEHGEVIARRKVTEKTWT